MTPSIFLGLGFGSGLLLRASGTFGTMAALPIYWLINYLPFITYLMIVFITFIVGIWICHKAADWLEEDDPSSIVWDEITGYLVAMVVAPSNWQWMLIGFVLFRLFDVFKPWPICYVDRRLHGGLGIMFDDVIAGVLASTIMQFLYYILYI